MSIYQGFFNTLGLSDWCQKGADGTAPMSMSQLLASVKSEEEKAAPWWEIPFPSLDTLNESCPSIARTRDMTNGLEYLFLDVKEGMKSVLDPLTQPLSWVLDGSLYVFSTTPWWVLFPLLSLLVYKLTKSRGMSAFIASIFLFFLFIDHYSYAVETLSIIFVCTCISLLFGVPAGIIMSRSDRCRKCMIPLLDILQTLPPFVYLIPLIFLFSVTESKLYGIAIILYAIVPIIRLTDLGIRLVSREVIEATNAFGMTSGQKLLKVELPLALPNIMAGVNQTIMMSLSMVVIASLVSAPGLGVLVLKGIGNLELGVGLVSGIGIVLLAVALDRVSKKALSNMNFNRH